MNRPIITVRTIIILISLLMFNHCKSYVRIAPDNSEAYFDAQKKVLLHFGTEKIYLTYVSIVDQGMQGTLEREILKYKSKNGTYVPVEPKYAELVHVYLNKPIYKFGMAGDFVTIPYGAIETIEVYEVEKGKSVVYGLGTAGAYGLGGAAITVGIAVILVALFKSSCPFIYTYDGQYYNFTGEIFSGAVFPPIERHDYLYLPNLQEDSNKYKLLISNEVREIQHINLLELVLVDHSPETKVLVDKYGMVHAMKNVTSPLSASDQKGRNILELINSKKDSLIYLNNEYFDKEDLLSRIFVKFNKPAAASTGSLIIRTKNNPWLDYSYMRFHDQLGIYYERWNKKQQKAKPDEMQQWSLDQKIPLIVYLSNNGENQYIDHYNVCGPMAFKEDVLPVDLSTIESGEFTIVLETGFNFWEIDYVAMSFEYDTNFRITFTEPLEVITQEDIDVKSKVQFDDDNYYVQPNVGDEAYVSFLVPTKKKSDERTIILHSKGYYDILMDPPDFRPKIKELKKLKRPLAFTKYSWEKYLELYHHQLSMIRKDNPVDEE